MRTRRSHSSGDPVPSQTAADAAGHRSVLLHESVDLLAVAAGSTVVDATLGGAGHAREILARLGSQGRLVCFDADIRAIERAKSMLGGDARVTYVRANFRTLEAQLCARGISSIDAALFDLGWSGYQLAEGRGFSFQSDDPLLMTYEAHPAADALTAGRIVNTWEISSIEDILRGWGEERYARAIAQAIGRRRSERPIATARELAALVREAVPPRYARGKTHPATKTFQALRIAVNDEIGAIEEALRGAWSMLTPGGRIAVISFHSVEDRAVKRAFAALERSGEGKRAVKKPVVPSEAEVAANPRARSAKLRVFQKTFSHNDSKI